MKLQDVTRYHLQAYIDEKAASGRKNGNGGLSARSLRLHKNILSQALAEAVKADLLPTNPCQPNKMLLDENIAKEIDEKQEVSVENDQELIDLLRSIFSSQRVARIIRMMVLEMEGNDKKTN